MQPISLSHHYPWQEKQWQQVCLQWQAQQLPHALLLAGPRDLGKRTFAKVLAAKILCSANAAVACGTCQNCAWVLAGLHPDLYYLQPEEDAKTPVIKIEAVRELVDKLGQTAQQGKSAYQVVVIEPLEALNKAAANALLKTLEEPSGQVVFLLVTHQPAALLATLKSRCQRLDFPIPPVEQSLLWLQEQMPSQNNLPLILALADHIPLRALTFVRAGRFTLDAYNKIVNHFISLHQGTLNPMQLAVVCMEHAFTDVAATLWSVAADIIRLKLGGTAITNMHQYAALLQISNTCSFAQLFAFMDKLLENKKHTDDKINLNWQLMYEAWFVGWKML